MKKEGEKLIGEIFGEVFKTGKLGPQFYHQKISNIWHSQMGPSISGYTKALNLRKRKLYIHIESAPLKQELSMSKDKILEMINRELKEPYLKEIHLA